MKTSKSKVHLGAKPTELAEQPVPHDLLQDYLDDLLDSATTEPLDLAVEVPVVNTLVAPPKIREPQALLSSAVVESAQSDFQGLYIVEGEIQGWDLPEPQTAVSEPVKQDERIIENDTEDDLLTSFKAQQTEDQNPPIQDINCMIFSVSGVKFAIPLAMLGGIHRLEDRVKRLVGKVDWHMGIWANEQKKLHLIDSLLYIMPERVNQRQEPHYQFLLQLDSSSWALACDQVHETRQISDSDIRHQQNENGPKWKAGTIISEVCTLLDVKGLLSQLSDNSICSLPN